jgi:hypothetical protein
MFIINFIQRKDSGDDVVSVQYLPVVYYLYSHITQHVYSRMLWFLKDVFISAEHPLKVLCYLSIFLYTCDNMSTAEHVFMIQCWGVYQCLLSHVNFHVNKTILATTFYENLHVFLCASWVKVAGCLVGWKMFANESFRREWNTQFVPSSFFVHVLLYWG